MASAVTLTVLGTDTPYPRPDRPCSGYLVTTATATVWMEAGSGTFAALQRNVQLDKLDALWFSHMHPDHTGDLPAVASWLLNRDDQQRPLAIYGPPGWMGRLDAFLPTRPQLLHDQVDAYELRDGHTAVIGDLQLISRAVHHSVPSFGLRLEHGPRVLAYSSDTGPCTPLNELADKADLFLCEAGTSTRTGDQRRVHCTPEDAARTAQQASARRLLLTHLAPGLEPDNALVRATGIHRATTLAAPGMFEEL